MDANLSYALEESIYLCGKLKNQMECAEDDIRLCVSGSILTEYLAASDCASEKLSELKAKIQNLRSDIELNDQIQMLGM